MYLARLAAARHRALLGLIPAGMLIAVLGMVAYRIRLRGLFDAQAAIDNAEAAERAAAVLASARERLSAVIEGTGVGIWDWDLRTDLRAGDDRCAAMIGYGPGSFARLTREQWGDLVHPDDLPGLRAAAAAGIASPRAIFVQEFRVRHAAGHWVWLLANGKVMERDEQGQPLRVSGIYLEITERKAMELALAESARRDRLTGLANRSVFMDRLERALGRVQSGQQRLCVVLFLDFDRFKLVNDSLGHEAGDELLRQIATRLRGGLRSVDALGGETLGNVVARFGGDEFLVLINDMTDPAAAKGVAQRLLDALAPPYLILGHEVRSSASIGIVTSDQCRTSAEDILRNADVAMYEAKRSGRACSVLFNDVMHTRLARRVAVEAALHEAIGTPQLKLVFQPIVEIDTGRLASAEALLRWDHPELGSIPPSEFIAIAEESELIVRLGHWVLGAAAAAFAEWRRAQPQHAPCTVSVNLSRAELAQGGRLRDRVIDTLREAGIEPSCLQLEVTEREVMRDPEASLTVMRELRELGVRLAMDDFGTGTSSLKCLQQYPFDTIKIDRSFIQDVCSGADVLAVIHATIGLIANLGMDSLAEGVEDQSQLAILQSLGCRYAQGYLFSKPVSAAELPFALRGRPVRPDEPVPQSDRAAEDDAVAQCDPEVVRQALG